MARVNMIVLGFIVGLRKVFIDVLLWAVVVVGLLLVICFGVEGRNSCRGLIWTLLSFVRLRRNRYMN